MEKFFKLMLLMFSIGLINLYCATAEQKSFLSSLCLLEVIYLVILSEESGCLITQTTELKYISLEKY